MQAEAAGRLCTRSVSELYSTDEVELLLEELRALEPRAPAGEDSREYEIAGSQTGGGTHWSPDGTVHSWDSHPHYRRTPPLPPARIAPIYCYAGHLRTSVGALRFFIAICSLTCVCLEYAAGGANLWLLPDAGRLRLLLATALFSLMSSSALLFMDITKLSELFPFNWAKLNAYLYISLGGMYVIASSVVMSAVTSDDYWWVLPESTDMLVAAASFGLIGGLVSGITALVYCYRRPSQSPSSALLTPHSPSRSPSPHRLTPSPSPPITTRRAGLTYLPVPVESDPMPCSSKTPL